MTVAWKNCQWCGGAGCLYCQAEREKACQRDINPIFIASRDDPADMEALRRIIGKEAIEDAFKNGPAEGMLITLVRAWSEKKARAERQRLVQAEQATEKP
ncbi:MAG: hypothetical protein V2A73_08710 [Pseudomonadota bacterium]